MIVGGLIAAAMRTYLQTRMMLQRSAQQKILAIIIMLLLAFTMLFAPEADAFIGSSLLRSVRQAPVAAFWFWSNGRYQNLLMMKRYFTGRFILSLIGLIALSVVGFTYYLSRRKKYAAVFVLSGYFRIDDVFASFW